MKHTELRKLIEYVLDPFDLYSKDVEELLILTAAVETDGCKYAIQKGYSIEELQHKNFALGFFQTEKITAMDLNDRYKQRYSVKLLKNGYPQQFNFKHLYTDIRLMILFARFKYLDSPEPIPDRSNISEIYRYYKDNYNSSKGASRKEPSVKKYLEYIK